MKFFDKRGFMKSLKKLTIIATVVVLVLSGIAISPEKVSAAKAPAWPNGVEIGRAHV